MNTSENDYRTGHVLSNGAIVIHSKVVAGKRFVFANSKKRNADEFVVWVVDDRGNAYSGGYHGENFSAAYEDFIKRYI